MNKTSQDLLIQTISTKGELSSREMDLIKRFFVQNTVSRNTVLEEQGKVPEFLYFVVSGYMRLFLYDTEGEEQTTYLCTSNDFIASFSSLINRTKATENVECITDCELFKISYSDTKALIAESEIFKEFSVKMFEKAISYSSVRANDLAMLTAEQRYQKILSEKPHFLQNVPLQYIASYLGMKPQSLSRIRKQAIK